MSNPFEEITQRLESIEILLRGLNLPKNDPVLKFHTREDVASLFGISLPTLNTYTKRGFIKGRKIGNRVLYTDEAIQEALRDTTSLKYRRL